MGTEDFQNIRNLVDEIEKLSKAADDTAKAIRHLDENGGTAELRIHARGECARDEYATLLSADMGKKMLEIVLEAYQKLITEAKNRIDIKIERLAGKHEESGAPSKELRKEK